MKKPVWVLFSLFVLLGLLAGPAQALTVQNTFLDWHIFNGDSASSLYTIQDEPSDFSDATLFCPLDAMDTTNNVTPCYYQGALVNATIYFNSTTGYPKLVTGKIGNAFEFDGSDGEGIKVGTWNYSSTTFAFVMWVNITEAWDVGTSVQLAGYYSQRKLTLYSSSDGIVVKLIWRDSDNKYHTITSERKLQVSKAYFIVAGIDGQYAKIFINGELDAQDTVSSVWTGTGEFWLGAAPGRVNVFPGKIDEARYYEGNFPSNDEIKLLYLAGRKKLSEPANLTVSSVTYDGSKFDITVSVTLPAGAQYIYVPADAIVNAPVVQNWSTGHKLIDVSGKNSILITIPAVIGTSPTGINMLAVETDEGLYAYGTGDYTLKVPKSTMYLAANTISSGKVTNVAWSGVNTLKKLDVPLTVQSGGGVITVNKATPELIELNAQSITTPVKISARNLLPYADYNVLHDDNKVATFTPDDQGVASFEISATGTWLIGVTEAVWNSIGSNVIAITITVLIIAIFAMMVVERTPAKFDDNVMKALLAMLVLAILAGLIKLIILLH